ncbi:MAG: DUF2924 domain-containing protein [Phycisphaerales bacterium]|nr:DUF2924 domain-containing protein [Phycisphaerales bacterium]
MRLVGLRDHLVWARTRTGRGRTASPGTRPTARSTSTTGSSARRSRKPWRPTPRGTCGTPLAARQWWSRRGSSTAPLCIARSSGPRTAPYSPGAGTHGSTSRASWGGSRGRSPLVGGIRCGRRCGRSTRSPTAPSVPIIRHEVHVLSDGSFRYRDQTFKSLSEVARAITGTRWSGPRFFGITTRSEPRHEP